MHADHRESHDGGDAVAEAAARWLARRDRGLTSAEVMALGQWKDADPRHAAELARLEASWRDFDYAKAAPELVAMAGELERATRRNMRSSASAWRSAVAGAAATVAIAAGVAWWLTGQTDRASTSIVASYHVLESAARKLVLDDGSVAEVRGESEVRAEFTAAERRVRLVRGEAHFTVTKDPARPFVVRAGDAAVRAVGTAFNVRLDAGHVEILVTEGTVQVAETRAVVSDASQSPPLLVAGQRAMITRAPVGSAAPKVEVSMAEPAEVEQALAWQSKRLVFDRTPLQEAVDAFNLHSAAGSDIRVVLGDESLRTRRLGGTFRAANVEGFVRLLEQSVEVRAERRGGQIVLLPVR
jgi:transmembrane sensor